MAAAAVVATAISNLNNSSEQLMVRSSSSIASSIKPILIRNKKRVKKRYCFPTLKSFSYYYNNRYYHKCNEDTQSDEGPDASEVTGDAEARCKAPVQAEQANLCVKYLSDSDVAALANQLSSYDKDLSYNVRKIAQMPSSSLVLVSQVSYTVFFTFLIKGVPLGYTVPQCRLHSLQQLRQ